MKIQRHTKYNYTSSTNTNWTTNTNKMSKRLVFSYGAIFASRHANRTFSIFNGPQIRGFSRFKRRLVPYDESNGRVSISAGNLFSAKAPIFGEENPLAHVFLLLPLNVLFYKFPRNFKRIFCPSWCILQ